MWRKKKENSSEFIWSFFKVWDFYLFDENFF